MASSLLRSAARHGWRSAAGVGGRGRGAAVLSARRAERRSIDELMRSVVKVFSTQSSPDYSMPWQSKPQEHTTGSGFAVRTAAGLRILTNAHVVADGALVAVRPFGAAARFEASIDALAHECDLALLGVRDGRFWAAHPRALEVHDELPRLQDAITVVGYPTGGDTLSITSGVVSRVEPQNYTHSARRLLAVQIDAAINRGNSGGPALRDGKVVGVAFQNLSGADGIGFIIPSPIIRRVLDNFDAHNTDGGFCALEVKCQNMDNPQLRRFYRLRSGESGVLVNFVAPMSAAAGQLRAGDVLTSIDGRAIANDGTVHSPGLGRVSFQHEVSLKRVGSTATVGVLRDGRRRSERVQMHPPQHLVPVHHFDRRPSYLVIGGLVFMRLSQPFLGEYGEEWLNAAPRRLVNTLLYELPTKKGEEVIVLCQVLPHPVNTGYQDFVDLRLLSFNEERVHSLRHLSELLSRCTQRHFRFGLDDDRCVVLGAHLARRATPGICRRYRIPSAVSDDLR